VLFIMSDDLNTSLSGFGHPQCKTPHLDALAIVGVKFERMYCQQPVCGPSRASIMSGLYPYKNGVTRNKIYLREHSPDVTTMSELFKDSGYYVARVGEIYHMGVPGDIAAGTSGTDDEASWNEAYDMKSPEFETQGLKEDYSPGEKSSQTFTSIEAEGGDDTQADGMAARKAIELLKEHGNKPFFLAVGFVRPHVPLIAPAKYYEPYDADKMILPQVPEDDLDDIPYDKAAAYKRTRNYQITPEGHKKILRAYYASVSFMDAQVGRLLEALDELGLRENTVVVFSSDHGYHLGEHNKWMKQHLFEESTRVPFIMSVPWLKGTHGKSTVKITELIDLYPTFADICGLKAPDYLDGSSMKNLLSDVKSKTWKKLHAFTITRDFGESIRQRDWRIIRWERGKEGYELYDLKKDPGEFTNVAGNPEYSEKLKQLTKLLDRKSVKAGFVEGVHYHGVPKKKKK